MPLSPGAVDLIRQNLLIVQDGKKPPLVAIGTITAEQCAALNAIRSTHGFPPVTGEVIFAGRHIYKSRVHQDGYTIDEVVEQITSAMSAAAVVNTPNVRNPRPMTGMRNPNGRTDRRGNTIHDEAVFECTTHHPRPELFSVIPKGDTIKPKGA